MVLSLALLFSFNNVIYLKMNFKDIHIGQIIKTRVDETDIDSERISKFMKCTEDEVAEMYTQSNLPTDIVLKWSKLLEYDFFRIYSHHLILFSPQREAIYSVKNSNVSELPKFRKNIYTKEIIDFLLDLIKTGEKTKSEVIKDYRIPKTTLYKWIEKYKK